MKSMVTATFQNRLDAESVLRNLEAIGVTEEQISMVLTDDTRGKSFGVETHSKVDEGVAGGATAGGIIGAALGAIAAAGTLVIPGLNLVVTGALVGSLAGLATGAAAGGVIGGLIGAGISEHEAKIYENDIKSGSILIAVETLDAEEKADVKKIFENANAYHLAA